MSLIQKRQFFAHASVPSSLILRSAFTRRRLDASIELPEFGSSDRRDRGPVTARISSDYEYSVLIDVTVKSRSH